MKAVIIGATGHVGTYLVPRLIRLGYEVTAISRGLAKPYIDFPEWKEAQKVVMDRLALEKGEGFGRKIAAMHPDIVVDMISYDYHSTMETVDALKGTNLSQYLITSSIREHGAGFTVPADESMPRDPISPYGKDKVRSISYREEQILLPNLGVECVHHVHADDVAQMFELAIRNREKAIDEDFLAVSPNAITLRGFAEHMYRWFGKTPDIAYLPWPEWQEKNPDEQNIRSTFDHIRHCNIFSCEKARRILGYEPNYTSMEAVEEAVQSMLSRGVIKV